MIKKFNAKDKKRKVSIRVLISLLIAMLFIFTACTNGGSNSSKSSGNTNPTTSEQKDKEIAKVEDSNTGAQEKANSKEEKKSEMPSNLKVHFIDVGQADSILITQNDSSMLIDAGNNEDSNLVVSYLKAQGISKLDYVIGTHPHEDHIGGLDAVIKTFSVGKVFMPKKTSTTQTYMDVANAIKNKGLKITVPTLGAEFQLGEANFKALAPNGSDYDDANDFSIVIRMTYGNNSFLFTGDAEEISEKEMLAKGYNLKADVLKVGHHGSRSSTIDAFLNKVNPKYAVITVGKDNEYGHPHKATMDRLKGKSIPVYRTDEAGTIILTSDGNNITFDVKQGTYNYNDNSKSSSNTTSANKYYSDTPSSKPAGNVTTSQQNTSTKTARIKGNINSSGEKIYHVPGGAYYDKTNAEMWFSTEEEARVAGFRKSKR